MKRKFLLLGFIICLVILVGCSKREEGNKSSTISLSTVGTGEDKAIIKTENYEGVILSEPQMSTWIPDRGKVDELENNLLGYLNKLTKNKEIENGIKYDMTSLSYVCKNIKNYKRQYIGITVDGKKVMLCNFITLIDDDMRNSWKNEFIGILDGGPNFFQIKYNFEKKKYFDLFINGYA